MAGLLTIVRWMQLHGVIFTIFVFALLIAITYWPGTQAAHKRNGAIPLQDDR